MVRYSDRGPVEHLDRYQKAKMIDAILSDHLGESVRNKEILDIGCGNGDIAAHFAISNRVRGVDIIDRRRAEVPVDFTIVHSERLPFEDHCFDTVISHHVIEHVASHDSHLREIRRVLRTNGCAYIATPNRGSPIMSGHVGNDMVLRWSEMKPLFEQNGFTVHEYSWRVASSPNAFHAGTRVGRFVPGALARGLSRWFPAHMFVLTPMATMDGARSNPEAECF